MLAADNDQTRSVETFTPRNCVDSSSKCVEGPHFSKCHHILVLNSLSLKKYHIPDQIGKEAGRTFLLPNAISCYLFSRVSPGLWTSDGWLHSILVSAQ
jgi:hypothetical protein